MTSAAEGQGGVAVAAPRAEAGESRPASIAGGGIYDTFVGTLRLVPAVLAWILAAAVTIAWPDLGTNVYTHETGIGFAVIALAIGAGSIAGSVWLKERLPWLLVIGLFFATWQLLAGKLGVLPQPFFPPPQALLEVYLDDAPRLLLCVYHSVMLLAAGYVLGALVGFAAGVSIGWWKAASYWIHPVLRFIGPLPAVAWLPIAFFTFPTSWSASVFLIALATGVPVAILTWSGIAAVPSSYYDIARTLGANERFLIVKVAVPAAMPSVFVGLFMGLGHSFAVLVVAEMMGVKAGLGWYIQWAQGWASFAHLYAALVLMSVMCSGLVSLLFRVRDRTLRWQKGLVRW